MTKYRKILSLKSLGFSKRSITNSCGISRNTVAKVTKRANKLKISCLLDVDITDGILEEIMFP